jgi:hypothetical protein
MELCNCFLIPLAAGVGLFCVAIRGAWLWFGFDGFKNLRALLSDEHVRIARHEAKTHDFLAGRIDGLMVVCLNMLLKGQIALRMLAGILPD